MDILSKIKTLLNTMSLKEKIGQLNQESCDMENMELIKERIRHGQLGSVILATSATSGNDEQRKTPTDIINELQRTALKESPLGIPLLFGRDVIHGHKTVLPIPLALSATFHPELVKTGYRCIAQEAANDGIQWTFAPMLDISRDPRWGRCIEGVGEDPYLGTKMAEVIVKGFQGDNPADKDTLAACAKHYIGYGAMDGGRDYGQAEISDYTLRNIYLRPFQSAIKSGVATVMTAFHELNGTAPSASRYLVHDLLKEELGFDGFVVSDWASIEQLISQGIARDRQQAAELAIKAGVDMDMSCRCYADYLEELVNTGRISMETLHESVTRILYIKYKFGLFEHPYSTHIPINSSRHREIAKSCSDESMVLLKNQNHILPLSPQKRIVAIGPLLYEKRALLGNWVLDGDEEQVSTVANALKKIHPNIILTSSPYLWEDCLPDIRKADAVIVVLGESKKMSGEANSLAHVELPPEQFAYIKRIHALGKPLIGVMCFGRPIAMEEAEPYLEAILYAWHCGTCTGESIASILYGEVNPSGKLPMTFPRCTGQIPIYYNHPASSRHEYFYYTETDNGANTYHDCRSTPLYPFGYGLSYTQFSYRNLSVEPSCLSIKELLAGKTFRISAALQNIGNCTGKEVAQCYLHARASSMARPLRELKGFVKKELAPLEEQQITFQLGYKELAFYNAQSKWVVEPGLFDLYVGTDCYASNALVISVKP